jgi:hypothetical protein
MKRFTRIDKRRMVGIVTYENDDGEELEVELPIEFDVCGYCSGKGSHVNPSMDGHGISKEDFDQDPDFAESYFRGDYDVQCHECHGDRVLAFPKVGYKFTEEQLAAIESMNRRARYEAEDRHERKMGY